MARWTTHDVVGLAPDARAVQAARKLARPGPWSELGATDALVWGRCQGSGATPYQVSVDLAGGTFRCSCPSRKLPSPEGPGAVLVPCGDPAGGAGPDHQSWGSGMQHDSAKYEELTHQQIDLAERTLTHQPDKSKVHAQLATAYAALAQAAALKEMRGG